MAVTLDKRLYKFSINDHLMGYIAKQAIPSPIKFIRPLGPMNPTEQDIALPDMAGLPPTIKETGKKELYSFLGIRDTNHRDINFKETTGTITFEFHGINNGGRHPESVFPDPLTYWKAKPPVPFGFALPIEHIQGVVPGVMTDLSPFAFLISGSPYTKVFRYIGEETLNTTLQGSVSVLSRDNNSHGLRPSGLFLICYDEADNQGTAMYVLDTKNALDGGQNIYIEHPLEHFNYELPKEVNEARLKKYKESYTLNLFKGYDLGMFDENTDPSVGDLRPLEYSPTSERVRTSKWFDVTSESYYYVAIDNLYGSRSKTLWVMYQTSDREDFQIRNLNGCYGGYFYMPKNATRARLWYSTYNDDIESILILPVKEIFPDFNPDPTESWYRPVTYHVNKAVQFKPNRLYVFGYEVEGAKHTFSSKDGVERNNNLFLGGSLSCSFNAKDKLTELAESFGIYKE